MLYLFVQLFARNRVHVKTHNMQSGSYKPYVPAQTLKQCTNGFSHIIIFF